MITEVLLKTMPRELGSQAKLSAERGWRFELTQGCVVCKHNEHGEFTLPIGEVRIMIGAPPMPPAVDNGPGRTVKK